jgi:hypothetical protein
LGDEDPVSAWWSITFADWYGGEGRTVQIVSATAPWYSTGLPAVPLRWVLIHNPRGVFRTQNVLCTDLRSGVGRFLVREAFADGVNFQVVRRHLGFGTQRPWSDLAFLWTAPALSDLFSLVTLFAHRQNVRTTTVRKAAW